MQDVFDRYGLTYTTGSLPKQVGSAWHKVIRLALPNGFLEETPVIAPVVSLVRRDKRSSRPATSAA